MANFAILYYGEPSFTTPEQGKSHQERWLAWIDGMGDAVVTPAMPLKPSMPVTGDTIWNGDKATRLTGLTVITAESAEQAAEMAKGCPHLDFGHLEVSEVMEM